MMNKLKRFLRHVWMSPIILRQRFSSATLAAIEAAVKTGEKQHRAQVRFAIEAELTTLQLWRNMSARQRAIDVFSMLGVWDTEENNGVLIYVLLADRQVEIIADRGIHKYVKNQQWRGVCEEIEASFKRGDYAGGSKTAVEIVSAFLADHFPPNGEQRNEQSDRPVIL